MSSAYFPDRLWGGIDTGIIRIDTSRSDEVANTDMSNGAFAEIKRYKIHKRIERRSVILVKYVHGTRCACCNFDYRAIYGALGDGYIEVHHLTPLASLIEGERIAFDLKRTLRSCVQAAIA
jgi:5-methylcytosine-specific restriction protein A